jgi:opacity protein-like surface antigen
MMSLALPAAAQQAEEVEVPKAEIYGGYSYLRADFGGQNQTFNGWNFSLNENLNSWFGGKADFSGHLAQPGGVNVNAYLFLFGPQFSYRRSKSVTPFAHVLLGGIRASEGYVGISQAATKFAAAFGGGFDLRVHQNVAIRVVQAEYFITPFFNQRQDNVRVSGGLVLRFGKR